MAIRRKAAEESAPAEPVRVEVKGAHAVLHLEGVVGIAQSKRLQALALKLATSGKKVNVRCEHLQYVDCSAVQVLLALNETLKSKGTGITVQNLPDSVQQTLRNAGIATAF